MDKAIKQKSKELAYKAVNLQKQLSARKKESVMSEELLRSGVGVGASLVKAECAFNKNEQITRVHTALQNCAETKYWLELLYETDGLTEFEFNDTSETCDELGKLVVAQIKALKAEAAQGQKS
jgi:four helix bundle protein